MPKLPSMSKNENAYYKAKFVKYVRLELYQESVLRHWKIATHDIAFHPTETKIRNYVLYLLEKKGNTPVDLSQDILSFYKLKHGDKHLLDFGNKTSHPIASSAKNKSINKFIIGESITPSDELVTFVAKIFFLKYTSLHEFKDSSEAEKIVLENDVFINDIEENNDAIILINDENDTIENAELPNVESINENICHENEAINKAEAKNSTPNQTKTKRKFYKNITFMLLTSASILCFFILMLFSFFPLSNSEFSKLLGAQGKAGNDKYLLRLAEANARLDNANQTFIQAKMLNEPSPNDIKFFTYSIFNSYFIEIQGNNDIPLNPEGEDMGNDNYRDFSTKMMSSLDLKNARTVANGEMTVRLALQNSSERIYHVSNLKIETLKRHQQLDISKVRKGVWTNYADKLPLEDIKKTIILDERGLYVEDMRMVVVPPKSTLFITLKLVADEQIKEKKLLQFGIEATVTTGVAKEKYYLKNEKEFFWLGVIY